MIRRLLAGLLVGGLTAPIFCSPAHADPVPAATYVLHVPPGDDHPRPLLLVAPMSSWSGAATEGQTGFSPLADAEDFTVAYLDPQAGRWDGGMCCLVPGTTGHRDDVATIRATITDITGRTPVDPDRVYIAGASGGGFMAWRMACEAPDVFAAAAAAIATLGIDRCAPPGGEQSPVRVLNLVGAEDHTIPMQGGPGFESGLGRADFPSAWWARLRCQPAGEVQLEVGDFGHAWQGWWAGRMWTYLSGHRLGEPRPPRPVATRAPAPQSLPGSAAPRADRPAPVRPAVVVLGGVLGGVVR